MEMLLLAGVVTVPLMLIYLYVSYKERQEEQSTTPP